jgi:hypothetical protein
LIKIPNFSTLLAANGENATFLPRWLSHDGSYQRSGDMAGRYESVLTRLAPIYGGLSRQYELLMGSPMQSYSHGLSEYQQRSDRIHDQAASIVLHCQKCLGIRPALVKQE